MSDTVGFCGSGCLYLIFDHATSFSMERQCLIPDYKLIVRSSNLTLMMLAYELESRLLLINLNSITV